MEEGAGKTCRKQCSLHRAGYPHPLRRFVKALARSLLNVSEAAQRRVQPTHSWAVNLKDPTFKARTDVRNADRWQNRVGHVPRYGQPRVGVRGCSGGRALTALTLPIASAMTASPTVTLVHSHATLATNPYTQGRNRGPKAEHAGPGGPACLEKRLQDARRSRRA